MNKIVSLYLARRDVPTRMDVVQRATAPAITFILEDYAPASGSQARIFIKKKQSEVYRDCTLSGNEITFTPTTTSFDEAGECQGQLQIMKGQTIAVSFRLYIRVEPNIIDNEAIEASDDFNALETALAQVGDLGALRTQVATNTSNIAGNTTDITNIKAKTDRLNIQSGITTAIIGNEARTELVRVMSTPSFKVSIGAKAVGDSTEYRLQAREEDIVLYETAGGTTIWRITPPVYKAGDVVDFREKQIFASGGVYSSARAINFFIPLPKSSENVSASITFPAANGFAVHGQTGFIEGTQYIDTTTSDFTITAQTGPLGIRVNVAKTTAFSGATQGAAVTLALRGRIVFS